MLLIVELSGENSKAALEEIRAVISTTTDSRLIEFTDRCAILEGSVEHFSIMAFCNRISEVVYKSGDLDGLISVKLPSGSFHVRKIDPDGCGTAVTEKDIGSALNSVGRINFTNPDFVLIAAHLNLWYVGIVRFTRNKRDFKDRRAPMRPFFSPVSLDPKLARFMVNMSRTKPGDTILDPFCGTGGVLIEAGLVGRNILGNDSSLQMVMGARMNLKYYGLTGNIVNRPVEDLELDHKVDAVVTDLPYGRNSPMSEVNGDLYSLSMEKFSRFLPEGKFAVVMIHDPDVLGPCTGFERVAEVSFWIHSSLTRHVVTLMRT